MPMDPSSFTSLCKTGSTTSECAAMHLTLHSSFLPSTVSRKREPVSLMRDLRVASASHSTATPSTPKPCIRRTKSQAATSSHRSQADVRAAKMHCDRKAGKIEALKRCARNGPGKSVALTQHHQFLVALKIPMHITCRNDNNQQIVFLAADEHSAVKNA